MQQLSVQGHFVSTSSPCLEKMKLLLFGSQNSTRTGVCHAQIVKNRQRWSTTRLFKSTPFLTLMILTSLLQGLGSRLVIPKVFSLFVLIMCVLIGGPGVFRWRILPFQSDLKVMSFSHFYSSKPACFEKVLIEIQVPAPQQTKKRCHPQNNNGHAPMNGILTTI